MFLQIFRGRRVIARRNLPAQPPVDFSALALLTLVVFHAPRLYWALTISVLVMVWVSFLVRYAGDKEVDVISPQSPTDEE